MAKGKTKGTTKGTKPHTNLYWVKLHVQDRKPHNKSEGSVVGKMTWSAWQERKNIK